MMSHNFGWGGWVVMCVLMLAFWVGIFWLLVKGIRRPAPPDTRSTPEAILAERFARGEITAAEFDAAREVLRR
jgi:putative membrane protein